MPLHRREEDVRAQLGRLLQPRLDKLRARARLGLGLGPRLGLGLLQPRRLVALQ